MFLRGRIRKGPFRPTYPCFSGDLYNMGINLLQRLNPARLHSIRSYSKLFLATFARSSSYDKMADSSNGKKLIEIDVSSDTVCPWCFVGKTNLDKAIEQSKDSFDFKVRWHPYFLNPSAPKEGVKKSDFFGQRFGAAQFDQMQSRMSQIFRGLGYDYDTAGLTGNSMDCHRLLTYAAKQGYEKQHALAGELFINYHVEGKYIGDKQVLLDAAKKVGIEGAEELLNDPNKGVNEVNEELEKYSSRISGVPHFTINGMFEISGGQPPEVFQRAFKAAVQ